MWRSAADGSQRLQLTFSPVIAKSPRWSPDGTHVAFLGSSAGKPRRIFIMSTEGGAALPLTNGDCGPRGDWHPTWSPSGTALAFSSDPDDDPQQQQRAALRMVELKTGRISTLPESEGLWAPSRSPDGRYIAALGYPKGEIILYEPGTHRRVELSASPGRLPSWSRDGQFVYFESTLAERSDWCRVRISDRKLEQLANLKGLDRVYPGWLDHTPDGTLISTRWTGAKDIYALDWVAP